MSNYPTDETMAWVWEAKAKISKDLQGLSTEEILEYFDKRSAVVREKLKSIRDGEESE